MHVSNHIYTLDLFSWDTKRPTFQVQDSTTISKRALSIDNNRGPGSIRPGEKRKGVKEKRVRNYDWDMVDGWKLYRSRDESTLRENEMYTARMHCLWSLFQSVINCSSLQIL